MKNLFILTILFLTISLSCKKPKTHPLPTLPPITQEGKGTIGFMLGNEVWVPGDYVNPSTPTPAGEYVPNIGQLRITCYRRNPYSSLKIDVMGLDVKIMNLEVRKYELNQSNALLFFSFYQKDARLREFDFRTNGELTISRIDITNKIVAGAFFFDATDTKTGEVVKITNGRFDMKWK